MRDKGVDAERWPWELFQGEAGPVLQWMPPQAYLLAMTLSGLALLLCAFLTPSRMRGGLALTAFVLVTVMTIAGPGDLLIVTGMQVAFGLLVAGVIAWHARPRPPAAATLLMSAGLATAVFALFPLPDIGVRSADPLAARPYESLATATVKSFWTVVSGDAGQVHGGSGNAHDVTLLDWARTNLITAPMLLGLLVALLACLGLGGCWAPATLGLLLLVTLLGPPLDHALRALDEARQHAATTTGGELSSDDTLATLGRNGAQALLTGLRIAILPLTLGLAEWLRTGPRRA
jgi:hypothetical protein